MNKIIDLGGARRTAETEQALAANFWKRRLAAQVLSILPDDREGALAVLEEAKRLIDVDVTPF